MTARRRLFRSSVPRQDLNLARSARRSSHRGPARLQDEAVMTKRGVPRPEVEALEGHWVWRPHPRQEAA
jgi:hypothetical protein